MEDGAGGAASQPGARVRSPSPRRRRRRTAFLLPVRTLPTSPPSTLGFRFLFDPSGPAAIFFYLASSSSKSQHATPHEILLLLQLFRVATSCYNYKHLPCFQIL